MQIAQITDIHIGHAGELHHGIDARAQFVQVLNQVNDIAPDAIVISGDLCFREPLDDTYQWIGQQIERCACPVIIMAGNHDNQTVLQRHLPCSYHADTNEIYEATHWDGIPVLFLDTARAVISEKQMQWMAGLLDGDLAQAIIFMHHPPLYCGVPHMDGKYAFQSIPAIQEFFTAFSGHLQIFCGHYHVERSIQVANQSIHITPSTFFQIDATRVEFHVDHHRPGYRIIELDARGAIDSTCHYLP